MSSDKLPIDLVNEILRLSEEDIDPASIAQRLNLRRMEVTAILAHRRRRSRSVEPQSTERVDTPEAKDLWNESSAAPSLNDTTNQDTRLEQAPASGIFIGEDAEYDTPVFWSPADSQRVQNPHLMIMGESGSGKTYAAQCLVAELAQSGIPSIIFDYGQSFETDRLDNIFGRHFAPEEHRIGEDGLALNPFEIFHQDTRGPNAVATRLSDIFDAAFRLGDIQRKVFIDAVLLAYRRAGIVAQDKATWSHQPPRLSALHDAIDELATDRQYSSHRNAMALAARLTTFFMLVSISDQRWSWDELIRDGTKRVHVLQFRGLEGKTRRVLVELLLWHMFFHLKAHGQQTLRVYCVLDEAHHLSFREGGPIDSLLREARKFGLGVIFASQQPQDFSPVAYSNTASKLVFQTADSDLKVSKFLASKSLNYDTPDEIHQLIARLEQGHAFFITRNRGHTVHVSDFPKRATQWSR